MLYTRENVGPVKKKNTESAELEANKKIDKIIKKYNQSLNEIPEWIKNIENEKFQFKGKKFGSFDGKIKVLIKKNVFNRGWDNNGEIPPESSIIFENLFTYYLGKKIDSMIHVSESKLYILQQLGIEEFNKDIISNRLANDPNLKLLNEKLSYLYTLKDKKEKMISAVSKDKKETANAIFESYFFTCNKNENDSKLKEIAELLSLTVDFKSPVNKRESHVYKR